MLGLVIWGVRGLAGLSGNVNPPAGSSSAQPGSSQPPPLDILQARYARGEVSRDEYEMLRRDLQNS